MKTFQYTALDARGRESRGLLEANDSAEALRRIKEMGCFAMKVAPARLAPKRPDPPARSAASVERRRDRRWRGRVRSSTLAVFTRQLATLLGAGMPLLRGLRLLEEQEANAALKRAIGTLSETIEAGGTFSEGLAHCPRVFSPLYVSMARAGEAGGVLDVVLDRLATFQEKTERLKGKVVAALFYPVAVLLVAAAILLLMMTLVVPKFEAVFVDLLGNRPLPLFTAWVLGIGAGIKHHLWGVLAAAVSLGAGVRMVATTRTGRRWLDHFKLQLPVIGPVVRKAAIARFSRTLGTLVSSGVPILQALKIVKEAAGNARVGDAVDRVHQSVKDGESLAVPLRTSGVFPAVVVGMVDIGEQTGALPEMLLKVADRYDEEVDNAVAAATSLLEPVLIVVLALVVGSIVVALFLPIIAIIDTGFDGSTSPGGDVSP